MKKSIFFLLVLSVTSFMFAEKRISPKKLPQNTIEFISQHFPSSKIKHVEFDHDEFEVKLDSGVKIEFDLDGVWETIKSKRGLPTTMLPKLASDYLLLTHPGVNVVKIEQNFGNFYEVELKDGLEIYFSLTGEVINEKTEL